AAVIIDMREEISEPALEQFGNRYQPIVDLDSGEVAGVEALLRWWHPTFGDVSPSQFIPLAEQVDSISVLGRHVLATALADLIAWDRVAADRRLTVSVNLSPR